MSFDYDLYDNKSKESLIKEFKRTQNEIRKCIIRPNQQMYNMLFLYREEIRRLIKEQEKRDRKETSNNNNNNTINNKYNRNNKTKQ